MSERPYKETLLMFSIKYYHCLDLIPDNVRILMIPKNYTVNINKLPRNLQTIFVSQIKLEQIQELIIEGEKAFWNNFIKSIPPDPIGYNEIIQKYGKIWSQFGNSLSNMRL